MRIVIYRLPVASGAWITDIMLGLQMALRPIDGYIHTYLN